MPSVRNNNQSSTERQGPTAYAVPRAWLAVLTVLVVVPWLVVAAVYFWPSGDAKAPAVVNDASLETRRPAGPWGTLVVSPIVISPPLELLADDWAREPGAGKNWFFPGTRPEEAQAFLSSIGLAADQVSRLMATARSEPRINGITITPDQDVLRGLAPDVRAKLYVQLGKTLLNEDHANAFRFAGDSVDAWLVPSLISQSTRKVVEPLLYRYGQHMFFADTVLAWSQIPDLQERRRLAKALLRQSTMRVRLSLSDLSEVPALAEYWGRGGRRTDIGPLLESIVRAGNDRTLDIIHVLPMFAREHLYRYPRLTAQDMDRSDLANCLWTALNFFNDKPDDRLLDVNFAAQALKQDYYLIDSGFQLGDIVSMLDEKGNLFHAAVYLADGLVLTKNGKSTVAPWVILPLETVKDYYRLRCENPRLLYHRRKDL